PALVRHRQLVDDEEVGIGSPAFVIEHEARFAVILADQRIDQAVDGLGTLAAALAHDQSRLAGKGGIFDRADILRQMHGQRGLAGTGPAEQAKHLRPGLVLEPGRDGLERGILLGRPDRHQIIVVLTAPIPAILPSSTSPRVTAPTPAGVPVMMRSPARSVTYWERKAMASGTLQVWSARSPRRRSLPLTESVIPTPSGWPMLLAGSIVPTGAEKSKPFAMSHGRPAFFAAACRSRRVMSSPAA